jgi:pimeloyl-ACP methyl ester carboxylesterase
MAVMQQLVEYRESFGGFSTRVLELEGDGPPLVFLHGYADSADTWRLVLDELARRDRRAVALDLPGFGRADRLSAGEPVLAQLDRFAAAALESAANGSAAVLVGNSLGGCVAIRAAQQAQAPLAGIVPIGPAGLGLAPWLDLIESNPLVRLAGLASSPLPRQLVQAFIGQAYRTLAFAPRAAVDPLVVRTFASHFSDAATVRRYLHTARALLGELHEPFELERVRVPTLMVWGGHDAMVPRTGAQKLLDAVPGSRLELLDACGHCPQVEDPRRLTDLVLDFGIEVSSRTAAAG